MLKCDCCGKYFKNGILHRLGSYEKLYCDKCWDDSNKARIIDEKVCIRKEDL